MTDPRTTPLDAELSKALAAGPDATAELASFTDFLQGITGGSGIKKRMRALEAIFNTTTDEGNDK